MSAGRWGDSGQRVRGAGWQLCWPRFAGCDSWIQGSGVRDQGSGVRVDGSDLAGGGMGDVGDGGGGA